MSEDPLFEEDQWPEWLNWIASRVDELVAGKHGMNRFRRKLREWKTERDVHGPSTMVDRRGHIRHDPVVPLPVRRLSLSEKYALLAAIHDVICCDAAPSRYRKPKRIDPWQMHKSIKRIGLPKATAGSTYLMLCHRVSELTEGHRRRVESALGDVIDDLRQEIETHQADSLAAHGQMPHLANRGEPVENSYFPSTAFLSYRIRSDRLAHAANRKANPVDRRKVCGRRHYKWQDVHET